MNTTIIVGNLTADPEIRETPNGAKVTNFRVAHTPRHFDKGAQQWVDGAPLFLSGAVWHAAAENFAASAKKGDRVIVAGSLKPNSYEKDGVTINSIEMDVAEVGLSTRFKTVTTGDSASTGRSGSSAKAAPKAEPKSEKADPAADDDEF